jgi:hypothetical protein
MPDETIEIEVFYQNKPYYVTLCQGTIVNTTLEVLRGGTFQTICNNPAYTVKLKGGQANSRHLWGDGVRSNHRFRTGS